MQTIIFKFYLKQNWVNNMSHLALSTDLLPYLTSNRPFPLTEITSPVLNTAPALEISFQLTRTAPPLQQGKNPYKNNYHKRIRIKQTCKHLEGTSVGFAYTKP